MKRHRVHAQHLAGQRGVVAALAFDPDDDASVHHWQIGEMSVGARRSAIDYLNDFAQIKQMALIDPVIARAVHVNVLDGSVRSIANTLAASIAPDTYNARLFIGLLPR